MSRGCDYEVLFPESLTYQSSVSGRYCGTYLEDMRDFTSSATIVYSGFNPGSYSANIVFPRFNAGLYCVVIFILDTFRQGQVIELTTQM